MERDICRRADQSLETWKIRAEPLLLFSGPCGLGVAVNEASGRHPLKSFDIGWMPTPTDLGETDIGDSLILVGDKYDMGAFRISDPERNLVLASTDLDGVTKAGHSLSNPTPVARKVSSVDLSERPHYSDLVRGPLVWGTKGVYKDSKTMNIRMKFKVTHNTSVDQH